MIPIQSTQVPGEYWGWDFADRLWLLMFSPNGWRFINAVNAVAKANELAQQHNSPKSWTH